MLSASTNLRELAGRRVALIASACLLLALLVPIFIYRFNPTSFSHILASSNSSSSNAGASAIGVKRGAIKKILLLDGELRAVRSRTIYGASSDEAKIVYMPPEGAVIKAGDLVVELDSTNIQTRIKDARIASERDSHFGGQRARTLPQHQFSLCPKSADRTSRKRS